MEGTVCAKFRYENVLFHESEIFFCKIKSFTKQEILVFKFFLTNLDIIFSSHNILRYEYHKNNLCM